MPTEIHHRQRYLVNTDPQRRCYNGCHFSSRLEWTNWAHLETCFSANVEDRLIFWKEMNDYAVASRGDEAKAEFKLVPTS